MGGWLKIEAGTRYGRLKYLSDSHMEKRSARVANFVCDCGVEKKVRLHDVVSGQIVSCGCYLIERKKYAQRTHGESGKTTEYQTWSSIKARCYSPKASNYKNYGGRGIFVCDRWENSYENFLSDMGRKPTPKHSIERKDNDGPYSKDNCVWATNSEQQLNKRPRRIITINGVSMTLKKWAERSGISANAIQGRIWRGWDMEEAVFSPVQIKFSHPHQTKHT